MTEKKETKIQIFHRPDWHPNLSPFLGDLKGQHGYVTDVGTIHLLGPMHEDPEISKFETESEIAGPTIMLSAKKGLL